MILWPLTHLSPTGFMPLEIHCSHGHLASTNLKASSTGAASFLCWVASGSSWRMLSSKWQLSVILPLFLNVSFSLYLSFFVSSLSLSPSFSHWLPLPLLLPVSSLSSSPSPCPFPLLYSPSPILSLSDPLLSSPLLLPVVSLLPFPYLSPYPSTSILLNELLVKDYMYLSLLLRTDGNNVHGNTSYSQDLQYKNILDRDITGILTFRNLQFLHLFLLILFSKI